MLFTLLHDILLTFFRVVSATLISFITAIVLSLLLQKYSTVYRVSLPLMNFFRQISPLAWLPLAIIVFGLSELAVGSILFVALFFPAVIMCLELFRSLPREIIEEARVSGAHGWDLIRHIKLPLAAEGLLNILRILWGVGWSTVIAAEMLGVSAGLGFRILDFRYLLEYKKMLIYIIVIGLIGVITDYGLKKVNQKLIKE